MEVSFTLHLPRDEASVPLVRHLCRIALKQVGVHDDCSSDIQLALTEACTNVLRHAAAHNDEYGVGVKLNNDECSITVVDTGRGFDHLSLAKGEEAAMTAEGGRGIQLMRALVDNVNFTSRPEAGTMVHLVKGLDLRDDSILIRLGLAPAATEAQGTA